MPRSKNPRTIRCDPVYTYYKPRGVPLMDIAGEVAITLEELEALRLNHLEGLSQQEAGLRMDVSQSTISRHLEAAHRKIARALVLGLAIRITNRADFYHCEQCGFTWPLPEDLSSVQHCEKCGSSKFHLHNHSSSGNQIQYSK
ncbi:MAG: DUF134 domain-containing protein [Candidatus Heimdallarchaeota archaeon]|nr:MAG: DUF134 domain-containing protein [Candidatus Heimdallarchaeota archaeon]